MRSILLPVALGGLVCAAVAILCLPAAPPQNVVFEKLREGNHAALAAALRADSHAIEWRDSLGYTLLHWAAAVDDDAAVRMLLDAGADPNARDLRGQTPLHVAAMSQVRSGDVLIKTLLARGASADATDVRGATPLQIARSVDRSDLAQALIAAGATEPANAKPLPEATDVRVASAAPEQQRSATAATAAIAAAAPPTDSPNVRPRRLRPLGPLGVWARLNGLRPRPPAQRGNG